MVASLRCSRLVACGCLTALLIVLGGCQTVHEIKVDAINDLTTPMGSSYRLEMHDPTSSQSAAASRLAEAMVRQALASRAMYEAPENVPPDMIITAEYGVGSGQLKIAYGAPQGFSAAGGPQARPVMVFEKFLKLTAREPVPPPPEPTPGDRRTRPPSRPARGKELWNIEVSIEDPKKDLAPVLEVLAAVSVDYLGGNTGEEVYVRVESNAPEAKLGPPVPRPAGP